MQDFPVPNLYSANNVGFSGILSESASAAFDAEGAIGHVALWARRKRPARISIPWHTDDPDPD
jgi:hypothetical protein